MKMDEWRVPLLLFSLTLMTTTLTGAAYVGAPIHQWYRGLFFSIPLILILLTHEMGHYLAAKKHGVNVSPPWFIPLPPFIGIGTLGAVIRIREPITSRNALLEIGAAGPIWGLMVAVPILILGVFLSPTVNLPLLSGGNVISEGNSILYMLIKLTVHGSFLPVGSKDIMMHPIAFAGWIGLLITMINLIPVGQLDGGHVAFAWFGDKYKKVSRKIHTFLPVFGFGIFVYVAAGEVIKNQLKSATALLWGVDGFINPSFLTALGSGISAAMPWFIWPMILLILRKLSGGLVHPPVGKDKLSKKSKIIAIVTAVLFILIFMPVPMRSQ
jgi:membrane-associated protease RseP (regulator of RpoE activity)